MSNSAEAATFFDGCGEAVFFDRLLKMLEGFVVGGFEGVAMSRQTTIGETKPSADSPSR